MTTPYRRSGNPPPYALVFVLYFAIGGLLAWVLSPEVMQQHPKLDRGAVTLFILFLWPYFLLLKVMGFMLFPVRHR